MRMKCKMCLVAFGLLATTTIIAARPPCYFTSSCKPLEPIVDAPTMTFSELIGSCGTRQARCLTKCNVVLINHIGGAPQVQDVSTQVRLNAECDNRCYTCYEKCKGAWNPDKGTVNAYKMDCKSPTKHAH